MGRFYVPHDRHLSAIVLGKPFRVHDREHEDKLGFPIVATLKPDTWKTSSFFPEEKDLAYFATLEQAEEWMRSQGQEDDFRGEPPYVGREKPLPPPRRSRLDHDAPTRVCSSCGVEKALNSANFFHRLDATGGYRGTCKDCKGTARRIKSAEKTVLPHPGKSRYKGVSWDIRGQKWRTVVYIGARRKHIGFFTDQRDAALAYDQAAVKLLGSKAVTNAMKGLI